MSFLHTYRAWLGDPFMLTVLRLSMTCEKQFVPQDERFLYCSEA